MEAEIVRELLSVSPSKLEKAAEKVKLPLPLAREMRHQALNLMLGRCVLCETYTPKGLCVACRRSAAGKPVLDTTREKILRGLDPLSVLIRRACATCGNEFTQTVDTIIKNLLNFGKPHIARSCRKCKDAKRKMKVRPKEVVPKSKPRTTSSKDDIAVNSPFADSKVLAEMRPILSKKKRPQNRAKK